MAKYAKRNGYFDKARYFLDFTITIGKYDEYQTSKSKSPYPILPKKKKRKKEK